MGFTLRLTEGFAEGLTEVLIVGSNKLPVFGHAEMGKGAIKVRDARWAFDTIEVVWFTISELFKTETPKDDLSTFSTDGKSKAGKASKATHLNKVSKLTTLYVDSD